MSILRPAPIARDFIRSYDAYQALRGIQAKRHVVPRDLAAIEEFGTLRKHVPIPPAVARHAEFAGAPVDGVSALRLAHIPQKFRAGKISYSSWLIMHQPGHFSLHTRDHLEGKRGGNTGGAPSFVRSALTMIDSRSPHPRYSLQYAFGGAPARNILAQHFGDMLASQTRHRKSSRHISLSTAAALCAGLVTIAPTWRLHSMSVSTTAGTAEDFAAQHTYPWPIAAAPDLPPRSIFGIRFTLTEPQNDTRMEFVVTRPQTGSSWSIAIAFTLPTLREPTQIREYLDQPLWHWLDDHTNRRMDDRWHRNGQKHADHIMVRQVPHWWTPRSDTVRRR